MLFGIEIRDIDNRSKRELKGIPAIIDIKRDELNKCYWHVAVAKQGFSCGFETLKEAVKHCKSLGLNFLSKQKRIFEKIWRNNVRRFLK